MSFIRLLIQIQRFRKILIILINDSNKSNHSSKSTAFIGGAFTKKRRKKKTSTTRKPNTQPSTEHCSVRMRIILILCRRVETSCVLLSISMMSTSNFEYE